jgi:hypothetical protein
MHKIYVAVLAGTLLATTTPAMAADMDWSKVDQVLGKTGADQPGGVHKFGLPRTDLHVTVDGVAINPALALGGWLAFKSTPGMPDGSAVSACISASALPSRDAFRREGCSGALHSRGAPARP